MAVQRLFQPSLVKVMAHDADASCQNEHAVQVAQFHYFIHFVIAECAAGGEHIQKQDADASVHVEDKIVGFFQCDFFYR